MNDFKIEKIYKTKQQFNDDQGLKIIIKHEGDVNGKLFEVLSDLLNEDYKECFKIDRSSINRLSTVLMVDYVTYFYITVPNNDPIEIDKIYQLLFKYRLEEII